MLETAKNMLDFVDDCKAFFRGGKRGCLSPRFLEVL